MIVTQQQYINLNIRGEISIIKYQAPKDMNIEPVYLAVRNIRHILKNHQIISQIVIVNDKLLNIWTIVVVIQFYS
jgi:hypothetical protein